MDNREEILDALNDFSRKQPKEIPPLLEQFLKQVAKTGETLFPWTLLKALFVTKLEQVMQEFNEECINDEVPPCPNVENARFEVYRARIMEAIHKFHGAPFTVQRLCELLTDPKRHYKRCDKFMRGLEKNILVVSTVDPFGRKVVSESKNLVNGMDSNNSGSEDSTSAPPATSSTSTPTTPPVPAWPSPSPSSSSSPTTSWPPVQADLITPSTAPLLEVCDLPDPKEPVTTTTTPTEPSAVNGHRDEAPSGSGSMDVVASSSSSVTVSDTEAVSGTTPSADLPMVTSVEETVDSSDQQVAAEEMVGVEEEAATSTAIISQEGDGADGEGADGMVEEETVVDTPPVAAEVMKETTTGVTEDSGTAEVPAPAPSGDWLANITDKPPKPEPSTTESKEDSGAESQNNSSDASGMESRDSSVSESQDSSCTKSGDGSESQASSNGQEALDSVADTSDVEISTKKIAADSSTQPETDSSEEKAEVGEGGNEGEVEGEKGEEESASANKVEGSEESSTKDDHADDSEAAKNADTVTTASVTSDSVITDTSFTSSVSSVAEEQVPSGSPVPSSDSADMTAASSEASTSENVSPSICPSATSNAEAAKATVSSASGADIAPVVKRRKIDDENTTATASPTVPEAASEEVRSEDADTNSAVCMETDNADSSNNVPAAMESTEPEATVSSSEVQPDAPSTDDSSQAEPMEQD